MTDVYHRSISSLNIVNLSLVSLRQSCKLLAVCPPQLQFLGGGLFLSTGTSQGCYFIDFHVLQPGVR
jgi:hypothetical protein